MSDDWKPGDLAMIVREGRVVCPHGWRFGGCGTPHVGTIRVVVGFRAASCNNPKTAPVGSSCGCTVLLFAGSEAVEHRCVKIRPHTPDEQDAETIRLLTGAPVAVPVA